MVHADRELRAVARRHWPSGRRSRLCDLYGAVYTRQRNYRGRGDFIWTEDRFYRRCFRRQSRRALLVPAGAQFFA